jgi:hypothetical protein
MEVQSGIRAASQVLRWIVRMHLSKFTATKEPAAAEHVLIAVHFLLQSTNSSSFRLNAQHGRQYWTCGPGMRDIDSRCRDTDRKFCHVFRWSVCRRSAVFVCECRIMSPHKCNSLKNHAHSQIKNRQNKIISTANKLGIKNIIFSTSQRVYSSRHSE